MMHSSNAGDIIFLSREALLRFCNPVRTIVANNVDEVSRCVEETESLVAKGLHAAGYISYEAASAFDAAFVTHKTAPVPLLWFSFYEEMIKEPVKLPESPQAYQVGDWAHEQSRCGYFKAIERIRELIAAGDTYQVNYTFPMHAAFEGDALSWFYDLFRTQRVDHAAFIDTGRFKILSASPELFFRLEGGQLTTKPMKGTRHRGRWSEEDALLRAELAKSEKDQAENVMIVDLLRNDMGRISETGSVKVKSLFDVERYDTVWQMTSTITSHTSASVGEILAALFPSGSVTGAPKIRTMQIIREMEASPRGVYCGAIGYIRPDKSAEFNVAIRTVTVDSEQGSALYNVGGGITWGSDTEKEYEECKTKAALLTASWPEFELLESILFDGDFFLLDEHMERLKASAEYFGFSVNVPAIRASLNERKESFGAAASKVRLLVSRDSSFKVEAAPIPGTGSGKKRKSLGFAKTPIDENNVFLYHKTTNRAFYDRAKESRPDCDDVLLWNSRGEITESTIANVVLKIDGQRLTPPLSSGLLAGTMRKQLIEQGQIKEAVLTKTDLAKAESIALINSVRKWIDVQFIDY